MRSGSGCCCLYTVGWARLAAVLEADRAEPFADPREADFEGPLEEAADCRGAAFAVGFALADPVTLAFPTDFGAAVVFPFCVESLFAATDFDALCAAAERFGGVKRTKTRGETRTKPNFKRGGCTIAVYQMAQQDGSLARMCLCVNTTPQGRCPYPQRSEV